MTVVRSLAFQNCRKSIGQTNYYRRKGVQLSRTKATFAPSRQFSELQKLQQEAMKMAQYAVKQRSIFDSLDYMNCGTKKKYNAATKYNKFIANILKPIRTDVTEVGMNEEAFFNQYMYDCLANCSIGNIPNLLFSQIKYSLEASVLSLHCETLPGDIERFFFSVNNSLRRGKSFEIMNIGAVFFIQTNDYPVKLICSGPIMVDQETTTVSNDLIFKFNTEETTVSIDAYHITYVLFVCDRVSNGTDIPSAKPYYCTQSIIQYYVYPL